MKKYDTANIRNIVLVGSKGVGKTTFVEAALFTTKVTVRMGRVAEGNSIIDYDPIEIERKQSITSKVTPVEFANCKINIIDTPGYSDFIGDVVGATAIADVVVILIDSVNGVDIATRRFAETAKKLNKPIVYFINKMDVERADCNKAFASIKEKLSPGAALFELPIQTSLMEAVAECDEKLLEKYLEIGELTEDEFKKGMVKGIAAGTLNPVFTGSAYNNTAIDVFLKAVVNNFPSPLDVPAVKAMRFDKSEVEIKTDPNGQILAQVFKTTSDPGIGDIFFFRVYSGTISAGADVYNSTQSIPERMGHLIVMRGKERIEVEAATAGDIVAVAKLKGTCINDTLSVKNNPLSMRPIEFPIPVVPMAMIPKSKKDQDKLGIALSKLTSIDPTLTYHIDKEFSETIVTAMGEVQIDVMTKRLHERYAVDIELGKPHIPYREKITKKSEKQGKHKKQSGGHGQYGDCWLRLEPLPAGTGFEFVDKIVGGSIPGKYVPAVEKGVRESMQKGTLAGYPVVDLRVSVYDGSYHDVDSSDMSFQIAGSLAFKNAMADAAPQLLEPVVDLEVYAPQDNMGDLSSDISQRRGRVSGMDAGVIRAKVPMAELYQYSASLKSITRGAGTYVMHFSHYEPVPSHIAQRVIEETKKEHEQKKV